MYSLKPVPGGMMNSARRDDAATVECQKVIYPHFCDSAARLVNTHFFREKSPIFDYSRVRVLGATVVLQVVFYFASGPISPGNWNNTARRRHARGQPTRGTATGARAHAPDARARRAHGALAGARLGSAAARGARRRPRASLTLSIFLSSLDSRLPPPPPPPARAHRPARIIKSR